MLLAFRHRGMSSRIHQQSVEQPSQSGSAAESQAHRSGVGFGMVCDGCCRLSAVMAVEAIRNRRRDAGRHSRTGHGHRRWLSAATSTCVHRRFHAAPVDRLLITRRNSDFSCTYRTLVETRCDTNRWPVCRPGRGQSGAFHRFRICVVILLDFSSML